MDLFKGLYWFEEHGYHVSLPEHETFKRLRGKSKKLIWEILIRNEKHWKQVFFSEVYDEALFEEPLKAIRAHEETVNDALRKLDILEKNWGFKLMPKYEFVITFYGPGGDYFCWPDSGEIVILINKNTIARKKWMKETIIHEIVHIGIEKNIVQKYKLNHWQKERVVDLICSLYLKDVLPNYKPNHLNEKYGDKKIDDFVDKEAIIRDLPSAIEKFKTRFP